MMNIKAYGNEENNGIDRISSLPDDVRTHILSFLTTKETVQTCILSKRWINTWASVPDLKFDIEEFGVQVLESLGPNFTANKIYVEFVTKIELLLRSVLEKRETSCVNRFQLCLDSDFFLPWTRTLAYFIGDVMKLGPRECLVKLDLCKKMNLNTDVIFTCASLIHLQLYLTIEVYHFEAIELNSVNLPCLKTLNLNLDGVTMSYDSFKKLLLGCPVLEELVLQNCFISIIEICSNTLKKLVLGSGYDIMRLHISTPNLLYLNIRVSAMGETLLLNMPSLVGASIYISGWCDLGKYVTWLPKLIHSLSNVESLRLQFNCSTEKVQKKDFSSYPVFNNLKCFELLIWGFYDYDLALYFLRHSPKLQELTLTNRLALVRGFVDEEMTQEGPRDALVQLEFLKTVRIVGFKNDNGFVDHLINKLLAHVKIIGDIVILPYDSCC